MDKRYTLEAAEKLQDSDLPILLAWAPRRLSLPDEVRRTARVRRPNARIVEIPDAKTFVPVDQPQRVAEEIAAFAAPA